MPPPGGDEVRRDFSNSGSLRLVAPGAWRGLLLRRLRADCLTHNRGLAQIWKRFPASRRGTEEKDREVSRCTCVRCVGVCVCVLRVLPFQQSACPSPLPASRQKGARGTLPLPPLLSSPSPAGRVRRLLLGQPGNALPPRMEPDGAVGQLCSGPSPQQLRLQLFHPAGTLCLAHLQLPSAVASTAAATNYIYIL